MWYDAMPNCHAKFIFSHFTTPPIYAILSRYKITPMPGYLVTPAGSLAVSYTHLTLPTIRLV